MVTKFIHTLYIYIYIYIYIYVCVCVYIYDVGSVERAYLKNPTVNDIPIVSSCLPIIKNTCNHVYHA